MSEKSLLKNMSWLTLVSGVERVAAVVQTVLVARALGITDYGVYGLLFGTVGLAASVAGLQMGLTATVFVARYRDTEKAKAAFVISFVNRFALAVALLFLVGTLPFAGPISRWLVGPAGSEIAIIAGCLLVAFSVISGVQDGIIQGFEDFRSVALARLATTIMTLALIYPAGIDFGLPGVMAVAVAGLVVKYLLLTSKQRWHARQSNLSTKGEGLRASELLWGFSVPSMMVSLLVGGIGWWGTFIVSRQSNGFDALAVVNTGLQWRGPIFLVTTAVSSVAIPAISRSFQRQDHSAIRGLHRNVLLYNGGFALLAAVGIVLLSPLILQLYGPGFAGGAFVFSLVVASAVPQVVAGIYAQQLVAKGLMWQQLILHSWLLVPLAIGFATTVPIFGGNGYAVTNLAAWTIFALALAMHARGR
jgi:O-antigen/teichoic acid export membrane protein